MNARTLILVLVCFWYCEANSEFSALFHMNEINETNHDPCINSDITIWVNKVSAKLKNDISGDTFVTVNETIRDGRGRQRNLVMVKLKNKRRWKKLVGIKAEAQYKIEIANRLQTKVEVLLDVNFLNKSDCGVGSLFKADFNGSIFQHSNDSLKCSSVESSLDPKKRVMHPFLTPKCGCFTFRYRFAYRKGNATIIKAPDPISAKNYKRLTKNFCVESEEDLEDGGLIPMRRRKHQRRRGKKGSFNKKNRRMNRKPKFLRYTSSGPNPRRTLSRSKKDIFQIWEAQGRHATSTPPNLDINNEDNARNLSESKHEYEIIENEINTGGIYENIHPEEETSEEHDDYENENEDERIEEEEGNFIEDFGYEDENEDDVKNFSDYENEEVSEENVSENDEEGDEVNYDENSDEDDDESNENDENEPHQYDSMNMIETDDLSEDENYDNEHDNQEEIDKNCDSDESDENSEESEESEDETEDPNENEEILEIKDAKILEKNSINSANAVHDNRNHMRRRIRINNKLDTMMYNKGINRRNNFPRRRMHNFRNRRRQNLPFTRNQPFKPWKESNRAKWQRKHKINVHNIKASRICCRQGINRKKLILHNKLENNSEFNKTCEDFPQEILSWVEEAFNATEEFCHKKFSICCNDWSLLSSNYRALFYPMKNQVYV